MLNKKQPEFIKLMENALGRQKGKASLLFSGGIDSTFLAMMLKRKKIPFECFVSAIDEKNFSEPKDLMQAKKVAKELNLKINVRKVKINELGEKMNEIKKISGAKNPIELGVASTFYFAAEAAAKKGFKTSYCGLGADELFCGYAKFQGLKNANRKCGELYRKALQNEVKIAERIADNFEMEVKIPYFEKKIVDFALKIPAKEKISAERNKIFLRDAAKELGLKEEFAERKKIAAQYGSNFDKAIEKIAKGKGFSGKKDFVGNLVNAESILGKKEFAESRKNGKKKLCVLFSSGKDSNYALYEMQKKGYKIACLGIADSRNPNSYMYHKANIGIVKMQAEALGIPLIIQKSKGEKEKELKDLEILLLKAKGKYNARGVVTGALFSNYQRKRIEKICGKLKLDVFNPLWHREQSTYMKELIHNKFEFIFTKIACFGLDKSWLGRKINLKDVERLGEISRKIGINVAGEGGEFESLVLSAPNYKKRIEILDSEIKMENEFTGELVIKNAKFK